MGASMPVAGTQHGSMFSDREDAAVTWYLPLFARVDPSEAFAFAASEGSVVDASGAPLDTATVTIAIATTVPPDVVAARKEAPGEYQAIPLLSFAAKLALPYKDAQGNEQTARVPGQVTVQGDGSLLVEFAALLGSTVIQAYEVLAVLGGAWVEIDSTFDVAEHVTPTAPVRPRIPFRPPLMPPVSAPVVEALAVRPLPLPIVAPVRPPVVPVVGPPVLPVRPIVLPHLPPIHIGPVLPIDPVPLKPEGVWTVTTYGSATSVPLEAIYAAPRYRPKYTITPRSGATRPIIDVSDLETFDTARSEFRELTSLGEISARYPSLSRVFLGQISGTVYAIPTAYGILHGKGGCVARIDAVIDTSPTSVSGCRFQLTFELAPVVDPVDMAQLAEDLKALPEASGLTLKVSAPSAIDERVTPTLSTTVTNTVWADAPDGYGLLLSFEITDAGSMPALVNANLLLAQLTSTGTTPLFGTIGVRLDDVYTPPVEATAILSLGTTCSTDDLVISTGSSLMLTNQSPNDLRLLRMRAGTGEQAAINALNQVLPAGQAASLPVADPEASSPVVVQRTLALAQPFPRSALGDYLEIHAETIQQAMHALIVNATAVDFAAEGITEIGIAITLDTLPTLAVPTLALSEQHRVESANVVVPIEAALTGLAATLTITVHTVAAPGTRELELQNDFAANPIFVLTPAALVPPSQPAPPSS
jgi:hypothetical protein